MNINSKDSDNSRVIGGLILVVVGSVFLLRAMGFLLPRWLFTWPMILILVGIFVGVKHNFRNNSWFILIGIGGFFLLNQVMAGTRLIHYFWPLFIIGAGILFIVRPRRDSFEKPTEGDYLRWEDTTGTTGTETTTGTRTASMDDFDYLRIRSVFSGVNRTVLSKNFQGGHIAAVFGGSEINFSQAEITGPVIIKTEVVFGGVQLIVPPHWAVQNEIDGIFHGVEDKRKFNVMPDINPTKVVILRGSVIFGGIEIKNPR